VTFTVLTSQAALDRPNPFFLSDQRHDIFHCWVKVFVGINETMKVDEFEQYGRRQNLEIVVVPEKENEDTNEIIQNVAKLLDVDILPCHISTSHRLHKNANRSGKDPNSPVPIIVRFTNRNIRNKIYANRRKARNANMNQFSVPGTKKIFINKNLMPTRKLLFWKVKQQVKAEK